MSISFACNHCGVVFETEVSNAGRTSRCPNCGGAVQIPEFAGVGPGVMLGGFELIRTLGSGSMGQVFLATQVSLHRQVAVKVLSAALSADEEYIQRFENEVRTLARLDHPNIVTAFEAGRALGYQFLAMSYVDGETLEQLMARQGRLPEQRVLPIVESVAEALAYAWDRFKILHRDVKPANVMLDKNGTVQLTDLGIALQGDSPTAEEDGFVIGTPHYMSPEQAQSGVGLDSRADQYSLAATAYHLLAGTAPFDGTEPKETLQRVLTEPCPPLAEVNPEVSEGCSRLIARMMAKDREERYPDWDRALKAIRRVAVGEFPEERKRAKRKGKGKKFRVHGAAGMARETSRGTARGSERGAVAVETGTRASLTDVDLEVAALPAAGRRRGGGRGLVVGVLLALVAAGAAAWMMTVEPDGGGAPAAGDGGALVQQPDSDVGTADGGGTEGDTVQSGGGHRPAETAPAESLEDRLRRALARIVNELRSDPNRVVEARKALEGLAGRCRGTAVAGAVQSELARVRAAEAAAVSRVLATLKAEADRLAAAGDQAAALGVYTGYDGPLADRTRGERQVAAERLRGQLAEQVQAAAAAARAAQMVRGMKQELAEALLHRNWAGARGVAERIGESPAAADATVAAMVRQAKAVSAMPDRIRRSLQLQIGRELELDLRDGPVKVELLTVGVRDMTVRRITEAEGMTVRRKERIPLAALTVKERLKRLGDEATPERLIMEGLLAVEVDRREVAEGRFRKAGGALAEALIDRLDFISATEMELAAARDLARLLGRHGVNPALMSPDAALSQLAGFDPEPVEQEQVEAAVAALRERYPKARAVEEWRAVLDILSGHRVAFAAPFGGAGEVGGGWPGAADGLVFAWKDTASGGGVLPSGGAAFAEDGAMQCGVGRFTAKVREHRLWRAFRRAGGLSVGAAVWLSGEAQGGPARIVSWSNGALERNFTLGQEGNGFVFRLRTTQTDLNGVNGAMAFVMPGTGWQHVAVTYGGGGLTAYVNGVAVMRSEQVQGDFENWRAFPLVFGNEHGAERPWRGKLSHVTLHNRCLSAEEVRSMAAGWRASTAGDGAGFASPAAFRGGGADGDPMLIVE